MKRAFGFGLILVTGCGSLAGLLNSSSQPPVTPPTCVVRYVPLGPGVELGLDDCENYWVRYDSTCSILTADGSRMIEIPCPAEGDTLGK